MYAQMKSQIILAGSGGCMRELAWQMPGPGRFQDM